MLISLNCRDQIHHHKFPPWPSTATTQQQCLSLAWKRVDWLIRERLRSCNGLLTGLPTKRNRNEWRDQRHWLWLIRTGVCGDVFNRWRFLWEKKRDPGYTSQMRWLLNQNHCNQLHFSPCCKLKHMHTQSSNNLHLKKKKFYPLWEEEQMQKNERPLQQHFDNRILLFWSDLFLKRKKMQRTWSTHKVPSHQRLSIVSWITCDGWDLWIRICIKRFTTF